MTNAEQARREINSFTRQLEQIAHSGVATFEKLMAAADKTPDATASAAEVALMAVLEKFGLAAAEIGREWYLTCRAAADLELAEYTGALFEGYSPDEISEMVQKVVAQSAAKDEGPVKLRSRLKNLADERIVDSARRSIRISGDKDPHRPRFARVPRGNRECGFCIMLASKGFVYRSADSAGATKRFHPHCRCMVVPSWGDSTLKISGYDPAAYLEKWKAAEMKLEVQGASRPGNERSREKQIISQFEAMFPELVRSKGGRQKLRPRVDVETWDGSPLEPRAVWANKIQAWYSGEAARALRAWAEEEYSEKLPMYRAVQEFLLGRRTDPDGVLQQVVDALDAAIAAAIAEEDYTVERAHPISGLGVKTTEELLSLPGAMIDVKPYMASSISKLVYVDDEQRVSLRVLIRAGSTAAPLWKHSQYAAQGEVLLPRMSKLKILDTWERNGTWTVLAELAGRAR